MLRPYTDLPERALQSRAESALPAEDRPCPSEQPRRVPDVAGDDAQAPSSPDPARLSQCARVEMATGRKGAVRLHPVTAGGAHVRQAGRAIGARRPTRDGKGGPADRMLRLLHTADVHLGARHADLGDQAAAQRERQFAAFKATIDLAIEEKVDIVLIAGDLFD